MSHRRVTCHAPSPSPCDEALWRRPPPPGHLPSGFPKHRTPQRGQQIPGGGRGAAHSPRPRWKAGKGRKCPPGALPAESSPCPDPRAGLGARGETSMLLPPKCSRVKSLLCPPTPSTKLALWKGGVGGIFAQTSVPAPRNRSCNMIRGTLPSFTANCRLRKVPLSYFSHTHTHTHSHTPRVFSSCLAGVDTQTSSRQSLFSLQCPSHTL